LPTENTWTLLYRSATGTTTPVYAAVSNNNAAFTLSGSARPFVVADLPGWGDTSFRSVNVALPAPTATIGTMYDTGTHGWYEIAPTIGAGTTAGMRFCIDAGGTNYLRLYHNLTNVVLERWDAGVLGATLINTAATYGAGRRLIARVLPTGANLLVRVFYNDVMISTEQTVTTAAIIANTNTTWESSDINNTFANYIVMPAFYTLPSWA
jgi:hypothetical protein